MREKATWRRAWDMVPRMPKHRLRLGVQPQVLPDVRNLV